VEETIIKAKILSGLAPIFIRPWHGIPKTGWHCTKARDKNKLLLAAKHDTDLPAILEKFPTITTGKPCHHAYYLGITAKAITPVL